MVNRDVTAVKLADLAGRVERIRGRTKASAAELASDQDAFELVSFNLMLAVQLCCDIASHIIADEQLPAVRSLGEVFMRLAEARILTGGTAKGMSRVANLRNVVAHGDASIDPAIVHHAATDGVADLERFAQEIAAWCNARP